VLFYVFTAAIVPAGHMAAPLGSGAAFHLCPGDARSSVILDALAAERSGSTGHHEHHTSHGSGDPDSETNDQDHGVSETSADPGCLFAGVSFALADNIDGIGVDIVEPLRVVAPPSTAAYRTVPWLRPPPRSPPA